MLTLEKFEEASEVVRRVTLETKLVYSDYFSQQTGNTYSPSLLNTLETTLDNINIINSNTVETAAAYPIS